MTTITEAPTRRIIYQRPDALTDTSRTTAPAAPTASSTGSWPRCSTRWIWHPAHHRRRLGRLQRVRLDYFNVDFVESPHGRAPAVATGVRRVQPDAFVFTYQGDGDLAAIGTAEIVHAAARGERISVDLRQQRRSTA